METLFTSPCVNVEATGGAVQAKTVGRGAWSDRGFQFFF